MAKKTAEQPAPDHEFGIAWEKLDPLLSQPNPYRSLRRRAWLARWNVGKTVPRWEHRKAIIKEFWPEGVFSWHDWTERRVKNLSTHHFTAWIGPGGCGKTDDAGIYALEWWLEAPHESAVIVCSTTKEMLRKRIWGAIVKYHAAIPKKFGYVGELLDTACFIRFADGDWKNGIAGIAVQDGPVEQAINNIVGMHTNRVLVIIDEAQGTREAIMGAIPNLLKNPESYMHIMGNPDDFNSMLCRKAAPIDGWNSIPKFAPSWQCNSWGYKGTGEALFFDGRQSPAVLNPQWGNRNPWMINAEQINAHLDAVNGNENDPSFMTQSIGWPPAKGVEVTLLDASIVQTFRCKQPPIWTHGKTACVALDPAYGGADRAILQFGHRGWVEQEEDDGGKRWVLGFGDTVEIPIDAESETPIDHQIARYAQAECQRRNIPPTELAVASAGRGAAIVSILREEWGPVVAIEEGGTPSERMVGPLNKTAKDTYDTKASELGFLLREFALGNGVRGLPDKAEEQLCKRLTFNQKGKSCVEPKVGSKGRTDERGRAIRGFKERLGYSPDHADACQIFAEHCRLKGAEPGTGYEAPRAKKEAQREAMEDDAQWNDSQYTVDQDWRSYQTA